MGKINKQRIETLLSFLEENKEHFFLIGGHAAAIHFERIGLEFRTTKDFDIVLTSKIDNSSFSLQLSKMLIEGGYENKYRNERKTAYRFENPKSNAFPKIIEFFVEEGVFPESLDRRFVKLEIQVNEEKISAIVLDKDVFEFSKRHIEIIDGLPVVEVKALIALKALAFFNNKKLFEKNLVEQDDYQKHRKDIIRLLSIVTDDSALNDLPDTLLAPLRAFVPVLEESKSIARSYSIELKAVLDVYRNIFNINS